MKWIGWAFAIVLAVIYVTVHHAGEKEVVKVRREVNTEIAAQQAEVDLIFKGAEDGIAVAEGRLKEETQKAAALQVSKNDLASRETSLAAKKHDLTSGIGQLQDTKVTVQGQRGESIVEVRQLQQQIAALEKKLVLLGKAIRSVTAPTEL